jgi:hypothetical protein
VRKGGELIRRYKISLPRDPLSGNADSRAGGSFWLVNTEIIRIAVEKQWAGDDEVPGSKTGGA